MTVTVVDELEAVDVEEEQRDEPVLLFRAPEQRIEMVLRVGAVRKASQRIMRRRVREPLLRARVRTQGAEHAPRRGEGQRHDDDPERDAIADLGIDPDHRDQRREGQRNGDERESSLRRGQFVRGERLRELAHRRMEHGADEQNRSERVGDVEDVLRQRQHMGLEKHVDDVSDEHCRPRPEEETVRQRAALPGVERESRNHRDDED